MRYFDTCFGTKCQQGNNLIGRFFFVCSYVQVIPPFLVVGTCKHYILIFFKWLWLLGGNEQAASYEAVTAIQEREESDRWR